MSQVTEQSVRFQTALASIKLIQASAVLDLTEDDFDFLTSNKVWIATDRSRARRCVEACVYGTLDFVGYPRFPAPVEFIAAVIAYYVHPVNIQTACLIMEGAEFTENIINGVERPVKAQAVQNQNEPQLRDENAHNDKSVHGVLNPTYQAGLRRDAVQPDIEAERKKRDEIEAGKSYCSRRFGGATCDDKSAQIYARFDKNDWRIQPAEFYRFHDAEVNTFGYF